MHIQLSKKFTQFHSLTSNSLNISHFTLCSTFFIFDWTACVMFAKLPVGYVHCSSDQFYKYAMEAFLLIFSCFNILDYICWRLIMFILLWYATGVYPAGCTWICSCRIYHRWRFLFLKSNETLSRWGICCSSCPVNELGLLELGEHVISRTKRTNTFLTFIWTELPLQRCLLTHAL
jgi:hypothetical protein